MTTPTRFCSQCGLEYPAVQDPACPRCCPAPSLPTPDTDKAGGCAKCGDLEADHADDPTGRFCTGFKPSRHTNEKYNSKLWQQCYRLAKLAESGAPLSAADRMHDLVPADLPTPTPDTSEDDFHELAEERAAALTRVRARESAALPPSQADWAQKEAERVVRTINDLKPSGLVAHFAAALLSAHQRGVDSK